MIRVNLLSSLATSRVAVYVFGVLTAILVGSISNFVFKPTSGSRSSHPDELLQTTVYHYPSGYPLPSKEHVINHLEYTTSINYRFKMPNWVSEKLTSSSVADKSGNRGNSDFHPDDSVPESFRAGNNDYLGTGWSRGHLARSENHRSSQQVTDETFLLSSNIVPQDLSMNGCDWLRLENFALNLAQPSDSTVYIVSGPLWLPEQVNRKLMTTYEVIGKKNMPVPTHLFKILMIDDARGKATAAFIMPNRPIVDNKPLTAFKTSVEAVELAGGLDLSGMRAETDLCSIADCEQMQINKRTDAWRMYGKIQLATDLDGIRALVMETMDKGYFNDDNFLLIKLVKERVTKLAQSNQSIEDALFAGSPSYQATLSAGLQILQVRDQAWKAKYPRK